MNEIETYYLAHPSGIDSFEIRRTNSGGVLHSGRAKNGRTRFDSSELDSFSKTPAEAKVRAIESAVASIKRIESDLNTAKLRLEKLNALPI